MQPIVELAKQPRELFHLVEELPGGHLLPLSHPEALVKRIERS